MFDEKVGNLTYAPSILVVSWVILFTVQFTFNDVREIPNSTFIYDLVLHYIESSSTRRRFCMGHLLRYINHMSVILIINHLKVAQGYYTFTKPFMC